MLQLPGTCSSEEAELAMDGGPDGKGFGGSTAVISCWVEAPMKWF